MATDAGLFRHWVREARRGDSYIYHLGFLAQDRISVSFEPGDGSFSYALDPEIDDLANAAYNAWQSGKVHLFQRRMDNDFYEYIAIRR